MRRRVLSLADREEISRALASGAGQKDIAISIGRCESVVSREIARHGGREKYRAHTANAKARSSRERPRCRKLDADPVLRERVTGDLRKAWSPQQISGRLCRERNRGETGMSVSHEAIYTWMYALPKGELAEMEIALRTGRTRRQPRGRARSKGARIVGMTSISQRPADASGRKVPGHWEGDLVIGKAGKTAMGTLVERMSRYLVPSRCRTAGTLARSARRSSGPCGHACGAAAVDHLGPGRGDGPARRPDAGH